MMFSSDDYEMPIEEGVEIPVVDIDRPPPSDSSPVGSGSRPLGTSSGNAGGSRRLGRFRSFGRGAAAGAAPGPMAARIPAIPTDFEQEDRAVGYDDDDDDEEEECPTTGPGPTSKGRVTKRTLVLVAVVGVALALAGGAMMGIAAHRATAVSAANAYTDAGPTLEECKAWQEENGGSTSGGKSGKAGSGDDNVGGKSAKATSDEVGGGSKSGKGSKASGDGMSYDSTDAWEEVYDKMEIDEPKKVSNDVGFVRRNRKHLRRELGKVAAWEDPTYVSRPSAKSSKATVRSAKSGKGAKDAGCSEDDYYPRRVLAKEPPAYMDQPSSMRYEFVEHMQSKSSKASSPGASKSGKSGSSKGSKGCDAVSGDTSSKSSKSNGGDSRFVEQCKALLKAQGNERASKSAKGSGGSGEGKSGKGSLSYDYFEYSKSGKSGGGDSGAKAEKSRTLRH